MSSQDDKFELLRDPPSSDAEYLGRQRLHDTAKRVKAASTLEHAASIVLQLMLSVPTGDDPGIEHLQHFLAIAGRVASTGDVWGWSDPGFEVALTELKRAMGQTRELIDFQGRWR